MSDFDFRKQCVVLYSGPYRIEDEITHEINEGISLQYLSSDSLEPTDDKGIKGKRAAKGVVDPGCLTKIGPVPGVYDMSFSIAVNSQGRAMMKVVDLDYICGVTLVREDAQAAPDKPSEPEAKGVSHEADAKSQPKK